LHPLHFIQSVVRLEEDVEYKNKEKVIISLYKYYTRMCTRLTPFGYFSGVNVGKFSNTNSIKLESVVKPRIRLDMHFLTALYSESTKDIDIYKQLNFYSNSSLYKIHGQWRFIEYIQTESKKKFNLVSIEDDEILSLIIEKSINGLAYCEIVKIIVEEGYSDDEATDYLKELINVQVLLNNLYPSVSGPEYSKSLLESLETVDRENFKDTNFKLNEILDSNSDIIEKESSLKRLFASYNITSGNLLQVDLIKVPIVCTLKHEIKNQIKNTTEVLASLIRFKQKDALAEFKFQFHTRHDSAFVPLSLALDADLGIDYKKIFRKAKLKEFGTDEFRQRVRGFKMDIYERSLKNSSTIIELNEKDLKYFKTQTNNHIPDS
jgi:hypothetical protein